MATSMLHNPIELKNLVESLLFSSGKVLTLEELGRLTKTPDLEMLKQAVGDLRTELDQKQSSLMLVEEGGGYKMTIRAKYVPVVKKVLTAPEMPRGLLETLAVVAYKAPALQSDVIKIRTNKAYDHLAELEKLRYISREKKGRTKLIKLTQKFYDYFDIPVEKLKEKFANIAALEKELEQKEEAAESVQEQIAEQVVAQAQDKEFVKTETGKKEEVYETVERVEEESAGGLEKDAVGELEVYYAENAEKKEKKKKHKRHKKKHAEEEREEAAVEIARKILGEETPGEEKATGEEKIVEEGRLTVEKIKEEAARAKAKESEYKAKGLFPEGMPEEVAGRVEERVKEITGGEQPKKGVGGQEPGETENSEPQTPNSEPKPQATSPEPSDEEEKHADEEDDEEHKREEE